MENLDFELRTRIQFGVGRLDELADAASAFGSRALLVSTPGCPALELAESNLRGAGMEVEVFTGTRPNPQAADIDAGAQLAREWSAQVVVGVGGGSAMDTAKGIAVAATHPGSVWEYTIEFEGEQRAATEATLPIVAVPSTAGTGSEVTHIAVIGNSDTGQKGPLRSPFICPRVAIIDPELTLTLPQRATAATGFDAFTHAFERFMGDRRHPFIDEMAAHAMSLVVDNLWRVLAAPNDVALRSRLSWAATQAAMCVLAPLGEAGLHIFALPISAVADAAHGDTLAIMLPAVLADLVHVRESQAARLAAILGADTDGLPASEAAAQCAPAARAWLERIRMSLRLHDIGLTEDRLPEVVRAINRERLDQTYCRRLSDEDLLQVYRSVL